MSEVTRILERIHQRSSRSTHELLPLVYAELRRLAAHKMTNERPGQTLQPTALVHEAYLRLVSSNQEQIIVSKIPIHRSPSRHAWREVPKASADLGTS